MIVQYNTDLNREFSIFLKTVLSHLNYYKNCISATMQIYIVINFIPIYMPI
jgi:hypothetical protein